SLVRFLREDIGKGDLTSQYTVNEELKSTSQIICKSEIAVVAGLEEAKIIFDICNCNSKALANDGDIIKRGCRVMKIDGKTRAILKAERTALNLIMRMSGIATDTKRFVDIVKTVSKDIKVMGTRKTAPGLRYFDKKSIKLGGGHSHRNTLDEMILIKDNHLAVSTSIQNAISNARLKAGKNVMIE